MGIRQNLVFLEGAGWVRHYQEQRGMGRPRFVYALTEKGDEQNFQRRYAPEMIDLLEAVRDLDGDAGLDRIFEQRNESLAAVYNRHLSGKDLEEQVNELALIRTEEGFMANWEQVDDDLYLLREQNCALYRVASNCPQVCAFEKKLFQRVLDAVDVTRESHILSGDLTCTFAIKRREL
jgi:predicted ArsR family transcriptional regulator